MWFLEYTHYKYGEIDPKIASIRLNITSIDEIDRAKKEASRICENNSELHLQRQHFKLVWKESFQW